ncbi:MULTISPECIES: S9 family peptidase [unclassified Pseudactinotalea]|uniref:S9 family peptidase n=1 Tax=unclassified Pseudactinotalea TaxID=2649176 RepID=UPI00128E2708|nr:MULTISPECIES: S9 family peptidase [unclassified Pseudactinotalea]MPV48462.1 prolyl oligopeptidase family serine peptidase [Pseudactinotalea sp. HY160]QGH68440.1 prolyl oligopeptidase family serine peptidase [Pseudactinotalea sp. HY158]
MTPDQLALIRTLGTPAPHPDGGWAAVAVTGADLAADAYRSRLWRVDLATGDLTPLTHGELDTAPVCSPDGRRLAFLRAGADGLPQVAVMPTGGGEPLVLTDHECGVSGPLRFSADSTRLAYAARVPEPGRYGTDAAVDAHAEPPRHITHLDYRAEGTGFHLDRPERVFTLTLPGPLDPQADPQADPAPLDDVARPARAGAPTRPVAVTSGAGAFRAPIWFGEDLLALREVRGAHHCELVRIRPDGTASVVDTGAWIVGGLVRDLTHERRVWLLLADYGPDRTDFIGKRAALASADLVGTELIDLRVHTDPQAGGLVADGFCAVQGGVVIARERRGSVELLRYDGELTSMLSGPVTVTSAAGIGTSAGALAVAAGIGSAGDLWHIGADGEARQVTDLSARLRREAGVFTPAELEVSAADGYPVHGWVTQPAGEGPHPVLLLIHGGPHAAYSPTYFDEVQAYTAAGYAVVFCNPRGSASYGQAHGRATIGGWGRLDAQDVLAFLDGALAAHPRLDPGRVGVMGGSYGGYLTAWLTTIDHRWHGAIVERGFLDPVSFEGSSDIGWFFGLQYLGSDPELVAAQSPMAAIGRVRTPTLVIHSEHDWRCPLEQGQRWFVGLKRRGVPAEFLLFPGEGHELSRSGRPAHRRARFDHILAWWQRHLPVTEGAARS